MKSLQVHLGTYSHVLMLAETEENQNSLLIGRFYTTDELSVLDEVRAPDLFSVA